MNVAVVAKLIDVRNQELCGWTIHKEVRYVHSSSRPSRDTPARTLPAGKPLFSRTRRVRVEEGAHPLAPAASASQKATDP